MRNLSTLAVAIVCLGIFTFVRADIAQQSPLPGQDKHPVKLSYFIKDGKEYSQYDFGEGVFTVEGRHLGGLNPDHAATALLSWPQMEPTGDIQNRLLAAGKGLDDEFYLRLQINMEFESLSIYYKDVYNSLVDPNSFYRFKEVVSEYSDLKKYVSQPVASVFIYLPKDSSYKTPQGTPIAFWCHDSEPLFTTREPNYWTCATIFHYYGHVAFSAETTGEMLPKWQQFSKDLDDYFRSRVQEK